MICLFYIISIYIVIRISEFLILFFIFKDLVIIILLRIIFFNYGLFIFKVFLIIFEFYKSED